MAKSRIEEIKQDNADILAAIAAEDIKNDAANIVEVPPVEAQEAEYVETFDLDMLVEVLQTVSTALKQARTLFNAADSRGDAFINTIATLDNQIQGLVYKYDNPNEEDNINETVQ